MLQQQTYKTVMQSINPQLDPHKAMKKIMMKTLGERYFSAQETMHLLLSLKLYSSTFTVMPLRLNGSCRIDNSGTKDSLLDIYANHEC